MDKIKSILKPGKGTDEHALYGAGQGDNPVIDRLSKDNGQSSGLQSSATSPPKIIGTAQDDSVAAKDSTGQSATAEPMSNAERDPGQLTSDRREASRADANLLATREADRASPSDSARASTTGDTGSALQPDHPTPVSIPSNASIKSNVVGRVPTGSGIAQEQGDLPTVPATDGKFMNDEALVAGGATSGAHQSAVGEPSLSNEPTDRNTNMHQTALGTKLDPNTGGNSQNDHPAGSGAEGVSSQDHHYGRDAAVLGAVGAAGAGTYAATSGGRPDQDAYATSATSTAGTTGLGASEPTSSSIAASKAAGPIASSRQQDDLKVKQMPGAYPETPALESEKTLGADTAGVGSGAAVIAAQKAYGKRNTEQTPASSSSTHKVEPSPYNAGLDPRVDAEKRHDHARNAAGIATAAGVAGAGAYGVSKYQDSKVAEPGTGTTTASHNRDVGPNTSVTTEPPSSISGPQGSLGEKIQDAQVHEAQQSRAPVMAAASPSTTASQAAPQGSFAEKIDDAESKENNNRHKYAMAGAAAAATGAGAYGLSKHQDRDEPKDMQSEAFPTYAEQTGPTTATRSAGMSGTQAEAVQGEREFPLASHEQSSAAKPTNFSYPTGVKETTAQDSNIAHPWQDVASKDRSRSFPKEAAETGAAGAGGVAAYEALKHREQPTHSATSGDFDDPLSSRAHPKALEGYDDQRAVPSHDSHTTGHEPTVVGTESESRHGHRDAALVGAGAVGGSAAAGTLASHHADDDKLEKERLKTAEKKHAEHEKQLEKSQKQEEKARRSEEKARRSEEKHRRKSDEKEHKHGLIHRILHRHKSKDDLDKENEPRRSAEKSRSSLDRPSSEQPESRMTEKTGTSSGDPFDDQRDYQTPEQAGEDSPLGSGSGTPEKMGRNRLHKDPPPGYVSKHT